MKKIIIFISITFLLVACGEEKEVSILQGRNQLMYEPNQDKPYTGRYVERYENSQIKILAHYNKGKKVDDVTFWHDNGQLKYKAKIVDGRYSGKVIEFSRWGDKDKESNYLNGMLEGDFFDYYSGGEVAFKTFYVANRMHGVIRRFNEDGVITSEWNKKNGVSHGDNMSFYENGKIKHKTSYIDGKQNGKEINVDLDGNVEVVAVYSNGRLTCKKSSTFDFVRGWVHVSCDN